jgi:large subunit ribosomal protein L15
MQLHELQPKHKRKRRKRIGRGGKRGTYSGRGIKGQKARAGRKLKPAVRDWIKRYPKLRGYKFKPQIQSSKLQIINLDVLEKKFTAGETINPQVLLERKIIRKIRREAPRVKILGRGKISKALTFENCSVSKQAKEKIEKSNGMVK